jgi:hypothetical protein
MLEVSMTRFQFALSSAHSIREAGVIQSDSFAEALQMIGERLPVQEGDTLEIGVYGFPPARYHCTIAGTGGSTNWLASGLLAA